MNNALTSILPRTLTMVAALLLLTANANATLIGDEVTFEWVGGSFGPTSAIVGPGIEFAVPGSITVDVSDSSILVGLTANFSGGSNALGYIFTSLDWVGMEGFIDDAILTVFQGDAASFSISHTDDSVTVSNTAFTDPLVIGEYFRIDIEAAHVPEPATLALLGMGLAGVGYTRKRK